MEFVFGYNQNKPEWLKMPYRPMVEKHFDEYVSSDFTKTVEEIDVVTDIEDMPFEDGEFDFVFCTQVLEHVPHPWIALEEIKRILKPGRYVFISQDGTEYSSGI